MAIVDDTNIEEALELELLYNGNLFGDRDYPWARGEIERLSLTYTTFTQRLCNALLMRGDSQTAIRLLTKLTAYDELEEGNMMLFIRALALQDNKDALTKRYIQFKETLHKELGVSPSRKVTALYEALLAEPHS